VIFPDNLQAPQRLFVMNVPQGLDNNRALVQAFGNLPDGVELYTTDGFGYEFDRWMQDNWEVGYQVVPTKDGAPKVMITAMQTERSYGGVGLENFVPNEWVGKDRGYFVPGGSESSHNYGGNLEVAPPTARFPFGRMLYGGGETTLFGARNPDTMNREQVSFLNAQEIQGPALELSSEWLAVGHIDEIFQFVPDLTPDGPHPFKVVIASPDLAREALVALRERGQGSARAFATRSASYSVDQMLDAEEFGALNDAAQRRIDEVQAVLMRELDLSDDDFRRVPVLFNEVDSGLVAAFNPGVQNLVTVGDRLFVPDPEGPVADGQDAWQAATLASLADTDLDVIFVDVFESYHELLGEAHCGTNLERAPYDAAWWTAERAQ
jgi:protein-arginine deiminase